VANCSKCGKLLDGHYCSGCGAAAEQEASPAVVSPSAGWHRSSVTVQSLRSPGELTALWVGLGSLAAVSLLLDFSTAGIALVATGVLVIYVIFQQGALKGGGVAVTPRNFQEVDALAQEAATRLNITKPNLFIQQSEELNAYALGFVGASSFVVLHSAIVYASEGSPKELQFIIGHEFTHVKCSHVLWQTIAAKNPVIGSAPVLNFVMPLFFSWWSRQAEFTADRGGLIACGDLAASQRALARLAIGRELFERLNVEEFIKQAQDGDITTSANELFSSHPLLAKRILALADFAQSPLVVGLNRPAATAAA
jgi:Zn-dependent protease with chaperone function